MFILYVDNYASVLLVMINSDDDDDVECQRLIVGTLLCGLTEHRHFDINIVESKLHACSGV